MTTRSFLFAVVLLGACRSTPDGAAVPAQSEVSSTAASALSPARLEAPNTVVSTRMAGVPLPMKEAPMHQVIPDSPSYLLRATHVVLVEIEAVKVGDWTRADVGGVVRGVDAEAKLVAIFKGNFAEPPGTVVHVALSQFGTGISRIAGVKGAWSYQEIKPGARFIVISVTNSESAPEILRDPSSKYVLSAKDVLTDVELAAQVESQALDVWKAVALAKSVAPKLEGLFLDYLWARFESAAFADEKKFDLFADLIEQPSLGRSARDGFIHTLSAASDRESQAHKQIARLAVAFFRLLPMPEAAPSHDNLIGTYLPNLLDLAAPTRAPDAPNADAIFHGYPGERAKARAALQAYRGTEPTARLLAWIDH